MKRYWNIPLLITLALGAPAVPARAQGTASAATLQAQYTRLADAFRKRDYSAIGRMTTPDFTWKNRNGKTATGPQGLDMFRRQRQGLDPLGDLSYRVQGVAAQGKDSVATIAEHVTAKPKDKAGKPRIFVMDRLSRHIWTRDGSDWKLKRVEIVKVTETMNGKPFVRGKKGKGKKGAGKKGAGKPGAAKAPAKPAPAGR